MTVSPTATAEQETEHWLLPYVGRPVGKAQQHGEEDDHAVSGRWRAHVEPAATVSDRRSAATKMLLAALSAPRT